jgi:uncharacterized protein YbaP (TraB family)
MKTLKIFIAFLFCLPSVMAQTDTAPGFLWQVNINGSEFYLAGSIHAGREELYPLPKAYLNAYEQSDVVILELKEDFDTLSEMIFNYAAKDSLSEDQYLDNYLSQESEDLLAFLFQGKEETLARYFRHEGWLLNMAISGMRSKLIGYDPELAVDKYFHELATRDQKSILGLDRIETQLGLFEFEAPLETQVQIIEAGLQRAEQIARSEQPLFESYYNQDTEAFKEAFLATKNFEHPQIKAMYDKVFVDRNKAWVSKLIELSNTHPGNYFMLVGCGHYFGPDNLLELLRNEGFESKKCTDI